MQQRARDLRNQDIEFIDLTASFDAVPEQLYFDACCHFNRRGYEILLAGPLGTRIADRLARSSMRRVGN